eukprot:evm.model.scf_440.4 EVM.evm.TU.scf_440.4   scf_440:31071-33129(+)
MAGTSRSAPPLGAPLCPALAPSRLHQRPQRQRRCRLNASVGDAEASKGRDRPWIEASGQPIMAPRSQELGGDPFSLLLKQRIVVLGGEVNDFVADAVVSQLLLLDAQDSKKDIKLFINSPGGSVTAGMGIYDGMQLCKADVQTYCFGIAASMGAFLLGAGAKGKRYSMPNARIMIHQPLGGASGPAADIEIQAREIMFHKANINRIMSAYTGQPVEQIEEDTDRDRYMSPLEAKQYGLIDHIIGGDDAGLKIEGSLTDFPKTKEEYVNWGDSEEDGSRGSRFTKPLEPYTKPLESDSA